jgi:antibiotic biosynthesis monooxygenase (ABM) superfamily enzyme
MSTSHAEPEVEQAHDELAAAPAPVVPALTTFSSSSSGSAEWQHDVLSDGSAERLVGLLDTYMIEHGIRDTSNTMPFTLYIQLSVPLNKVVQFERWVARLVVAQSQSRPGYQGTLLYRPEEIPDAFTPYQVFVLDFKYLGAGNLRAWLRSRTRASRLAKALRLGLWISGSAQATIAHGRTGTLDNVWRDQKESSLTNPILCRWKLVGFSAAASWLVALACAWPHATVGALLTQMHCHPVLSNIAVTFLIVALSVYIAVPYLQQYFTHLLAAEPSPLPATPIATAQPAASDDLHGNIGAPVHGSSTFEAGNAKPISHSTVDRLLLHDTFYDSHYDGDASTVNRDTDNFSIVVTHRVRPGLEDRFETAAETLEFVISEVIEEDFIGITIIRPRRGCTAYSIIMQFDTRAGMDAWLGSDERRRYAAVMISDIHAAYFCNPHPACYRIFFAIAMSIRHPYGH